MINQEIEYYLTASIPHERDNHWEVTTTEKLTTKKILSP